MRSLPPQESTGSHLVDTNKRREHDLLDQALFLEQMAAESWRVCDNRITAGDGRFLAFVDENHGVFEVMQFADDLLWSAFPTMRAALTHVVETNSATVSNAKARATE
jgi:hypothetical protein